MEHFFIETYKIIMEFCLYIFAKSYFSFLPYCLVYYGCYVISALGYHTTYYPSCIAAEWAGVFRVKKQPR